MVKSGILFAISLVAGSFASATLAAPPTGHITGLGGVFVKSNDPKALAKWYKDVLGINLESWGGAILRYDAPGIPRWRCGMRCPKTATRSCRRIVNS